jgi:enoyl-CoA hydratase/carnithine racemase
LGIVMEVLPHENLLPRARAIALALCGASPLVISITKNALNSPGLDFDEVLEIEASGQPLAGNSPYALEAIRRFKTKELRSLIWPECPGRARSSTPPVNEPTS